MIQNKPKTCKGKGLAEDYEACSKETFWIEKDTGLCASCQYNWMDDTEVGKIYKRTVFQKKVNKKTKERKKEQKQKDKETRQKLKKLSELEDEAKKSFQKFIRLRDSDQPCISCGTTQSLIWDGGHYKKAELYSGVIFDENNCHKQCRKCNFFLGGNELNYREGLIVRYGEQYVLEIEQKANEFRQYKYTRDELIEVKKKYDLKIKYYK